MINGLDPIIIFHIYNKPKQSIFGPLNQFDSAIASAVSMVGIPVVIPLNEKLTGIYIDSESRNIQVVTNIEPTTEKDEQSQETAAPTVTQTSAETSLNVDLKARDDSIMLIAFLAVAELIMSKLVSAEYGITYLNRSTVVFEGLLSSLTVNTEAGTDLLKIGLSISTAKKAAPKLPNTKPGPTPIPKVSQVNLG